MNQKLSPFYYNNTNIIEQRFSSYLKGARFHSVGAIKKERDHRVLPGITGEKQWLV